MPFTTEPSFFQGLELASTVPHFKNSNLQYFAVFLDNSIIIAMEYLITMIIFKFFCEKNV